MCRIVGILSLGTSKVTPSRLIDMRDTMMNGGPDDAGIWVDSTQRIGFGHRRLSIMDLTASGRQPMVTQDGRFILCYNGEIYNFRDIRAKLLKKGITFVSDCDTEVLLKAFALEGLSCLKAFHGMWAFAIWDAKHKKLILARDRVGVKPLYYAKQGNLFYFGSELKSIMRDPCFKKNINFDALQLFLKYSYIPSPFSIFEDTFKLKPGGWLEVDENGQINHGQWWTPNGACTVDIDWSDSNTVINELENRITASLERRIISDVPVGMFLSGGVDSTLILALIRQKMGKEIDTFTIGFNQEEYNEGHYAKNVANALGSRHNEIYLDVSQGMEIIDKLPEIWDEPFGDSSAIATYLVANFARKYVKVALSADGGDELFCGYPKYWLSINRCSQIDKQKILCSIISQLPSTLLESLSQFGFGNKLLKIKDMSHDNSELLKKVFIHGQHVFSDHQMRLLFKNPFNPLILPQASVWEEMGGFNDINKMLALDLMTYHTDDIHVKVDRASMSNSLEAREPLLDHDIINMALNMPISYKLPNHDKRSSKFILRQILYKYIHKDLIDRPKMGFGVPVDYWLNNELQAKVDDFLDVKKLEEQGIFNASYIQYLRKSFKNRPKQEINKLWNILVFQMWFDKWMN